MRDRGTSTDGERRPRRTGRRTGRRPGPSTTREDIVAAARESFAEHGFDGTSVRRVATRAGVDPALVRRFFGSKEGLMLAALDVAMAPGTRLAEVVRTDPARLGEHVVAYMLSVWEEPPNRDVMVGMIRAACTNRRAAELLREYIAGQVLARLAGTVDDAGAGLRASLVGSQIVGVAFYRYVVGIEPLASAPPETLAATVGPTLQRYLTGDLGPASR